MSKKVNTFTHFIPLKAGDPQKVIVKNDCYFSLVFLGGNYLSHGNILQKIFGGRDDVSLLAGLRLQPDGLVITSVEEPNIVLDKRSIRPNSITNIPLVLNILVKIPAYMDSIGFSFKIATTKRSDNFSVTLDVLNDSANKNVLESFMPTVVGKALGIGKIVKDVFDKLDAASNNDLIQFVVNDFIIPSATAAVHGDNVLQEGYLVIFVKGETQDKSLSEPADTSILSTDAVAGIEFDDGFGNITELTEDQTAFVNVAQLEAQLKDSGEVTVSNFSTIEYDESKKTLLVDGKQVKNTYLVFKVQKDVQRGENLNADWSKKYVAAVELLSNEFSKTAAKLEEIKPRVTQALSEAAVLLSADTSFTPFEKNLFKVKYIGLVQTEIAKFH